MNSPFNLRVYGIYMRKHEILLTTETSENFSFTKFPGGGIEPGEGITDALKRELNEELRCEVVNQSLYYFNDFYQPSAFHPQQQILSFYYMVELNEMPLLSSFNEKRWGKNFEVQLHYQSLHELLDEDLTFPIDKIVLKKLQADYLSK